MKVKCNFKILPSIDLTSQVFWQILNQNIISYTFMYILLVLKIFFWVLVSLRFNIFSKQFDQLISSGALSSNTKEQATFGDIHNFLIQCSLSLLSCYVIMLACLIYCFRYFKQQTENLSAKVQIILKFLGLSFVVLHIPLLLPTTIIVYLPIFQLVFNNVQANKMQLSLSVLLIMFNLLYYFIFQRFLVLRYINNKVPWSQPKHYVSYLDYIFTMMMVAFAFTNEPKYSQFVVYQTLIFLLLVLKVWLLIQMPFFYDHIMALIKFNSAGLFLSFYFAQLLSMLMHNKKEEGFIMIFILSCTTIMSLANLGLYLYNEGLVETLLMNKVKNANQFEQTLYILLEMVLSKKKLLNNKYDGVLMQIEENLEFHDFQHQSFTQRLNELYQQSNSLNQLDTIQLLENMSPDNASGGITQKNKQSSNYFLSSPQTTVINGDSSNVILESCNHTLYECFSYDIAAQRRLDEIESINLQNENIHELQRNKEEQVQQTKINFLLEQLLNPYLVKNPDIIQLMFLKSYLSLKYSKNRFLCLTVITAIENINKKYSYLMQIENKVSQQYLLEICMQEQAKTIDKLDSQQFLDLNMSISKYFELLSNTAKKIQDFWYLLNSQFTYKQVLFLEKSSLEISDLLRRITQELKKLEIETSLMQVSTQIYFYTATFYQMCLRDSISSNSYFKKLNQSKIHQNMNHSKSALMGFDEVGVAIVDGNFANMGKILYCNKIVLKTLMYCANDVIGKTVHVLMPRQIAQVHDRFWNRFKVLGIPSVLEKQRFLFMRDKKGYIFPYKIFIKFMYHPTFGYSFMGIFRKHKTIILNEVDKPIKIDSIFFLITNKVGRIIEVSNNCDKYLGLSSPILECLSNFLEEGLNVYHFNANLAISNYDFQKNSCVMLSRLQLDTSILTRFDKELELDNIQRSTNVRAHQFRVNVKIVKESYGQDDVTLFYYMIGIADEVSNISSITVGKVVENSIDINSDSFQDPLAQIIEGSSLMTFSRPSMQSIMSQSLSGSVSSQSSHSNLDELKYLEENIDYQKTPKQLLIVKLIFNSIIFLILSLSIVLIILNTIQKGQQIDLIGIVKQAQENQLYLSQLCVLSRSHTNINLGLEPQKSTAGDQRDDLILNMSLKIIDSFRNNQQDLGFYNTHSNADMIKTNKIKMYSLLSNHTIDSTSQSVNYATNEFLVKANELFTSKNFQSKELTYLSTSQDHISAIDLTAFYVTYNSQKDFKDQILNIADEESLLIELKHTSYRFVTMIFMVVASCTILIGAFTALYFYSKIVDNSTKMLSFFSELGPKLIEYCYNGSRDFNYFMLSDQDNIVYKDYKSLQQRKEKAQEEMLENTQKNIGSSDLKQVTFATTAVYETSDNLKDDPKTNNHQMIEEFKDSDLHDEDEGAGKEQVLQSKMIKQRKQLKKLSKEKKLMMKEMMKGNGKFEAEYETSSGAFNNNEETQAKDISSSNLAQIFVQWKLKKMGTFSFFFFLLSGLFASYFVIQYLLIDIFQNKVQVHCDHLKKIYFSNSCLNYFLSDLREMESQNNLNDYIQFNDAYNECLESNQNLYFWLNNEKKVTEIANAYEQLDSPKSICSLLQQTYTNLTYLNEDSCNSIFNGIFQKSIYQVVSVFLHQGLQSSISFASQSNKSLSFLNATLKDQNQIDMIDAQMFYFQYAAQILSENIHNVLTKEENNIDSQQLYIFGVYLFGLMLMLFILNCFVFVQMRKSIWNSKIIFKLLPLEDLDISIKKRVQTFLFKQ